MVILGLTAVTHIYYTALDLNLFWIALMVGYVLRGAGACSFDRLLAQGLALRGVRDRFFQRNQTGSNRLLSSCLAAVADADTDAHKRSCALRHERKSHAFSFLVAAAFSNFIVWQRGLCRVAK